MRTNTADPLTWDDVKILHTNKENLMSDSALMVQWSRIINVLQEIMNPKMLIPAEELLDLLCIIKNNSVTIRWAVEPFGFVWTMKLFSTKQ